MGMDSVFGSRKILSRISKFDGIQHIFTRKLKSRHKKRPQSNEGLLHKNKTK
jgi:hypothetical protein